MMKSALLMAALLTIVGVASAAQAAEPAPVSEGKAKIDTNGDGAVSKAEFMAAQEKRFNEMDVNGNGTITDDEYKASMDKWKAKRQEMRDMVKARMEEKAKAMQDAAKDAKPVDIKQ